MATSAASESFGERLEAWIDEHCLGEEFEARLATLDHEPDLLSEGVCPETGLRTTECECWLDAEVPFGGEGMDIGEYTDAEEADEFTRGMEPDEDECPKCGNCAHNYTCEYEGGE